MSVNLIELVKGQLGDTVIEQLGGMLGESTDSTRQAVDASVPTILGSIVDRVSNDSEAGGMLSNVLDNLDDGLADDFSGFLQPEKQESLLEKGSGLLSGLLGDNMTSVIDMVSKFSGVGRESSSSLMSMVMPLVLGFIGKQRSTDGLDESGVMNLLAGQKDFISDSMPSGMTDLLGASGIMSGLAGMVAGAATDVVGGVKDAAGSAVDAAGDAASNVVDAAADMASGAKDAAGSAVDVASDAASNVADAAADMASGAKEAAGSAVDAAGEAVSNVADAAADVAGGAKEAAGSAVDAAGEAVSNVADAAADVAGGAKEAAGSAVDAAGEAVSNVADAAADVAGGAKEAVTDAASEAREAVSNAAGSAADAAGQAASAGGSMIRKILPIALVVLVLLFLLKQCM